MTRDELEAFLAIAERRSFTGAARHLHRSQPAISRRIEHLEGTLGAALFERVGRRVTLTGAGRALQPHAEAALASMRDGERAVRDHGARGTGETLRVAIVGTLADSHLVEALRVLTGRFRDAHVDLRTATSREVSALVRSGEAELGLRYFADADAHLESTPLGAERLYVVLPAAHPVTAGRVRDLRRFAGERWLAFPPERGQSDSYGHLLQRELHAAGLADAARTEVDSLTAQKRLVQAGLGIALMPRSSVREELRLGSLRLVALAGRRAALPVVAIRRRRGHHSVVAAAFLSLLAEHARALLDAR